MHSNHVPEIPNSIGIMVIQAVYLFKNHEISIILWPFTNVRNSPATKRTAVFYAKEKRVLCESYPTATASLALASNE